MKEEVPWRFQNTDLACQKCIAVSLFQRAGEIWRKLLAYAGLIFFGEQSTGKLLIFSQVILSLQLSFAVIPLGAVVTIVVSLNIWLLLQTFWGWSHS